MIYRMGSWRRDCWVKELLSMRLLSGLHRLARSEGTKGVVKEKSFSGELNEMC